ncbi:MAG: TIGR00266 family protein [Chloroflexi bacterium]|nr:TIGR00266 family protein [Chloroflexota bacterium]
MDFQLSERGSYGSVLVTIDPGERVVSEAGAMFRASSNIDIDVTTRSRGSGGLLSGIRRMLSSESFFLSTYQTIDGNAGEVALAPTLPGDVGLIDVADGIRYFCTGGSYLASSSSLALDTQFQGFRGMFSGESLFFLTIDGRGTLVVSAFGSIRELEVDGALTVDTGHVVAFEDTLEFTVGRAGGSWIQSFLSSEGLVMNFTGRGKIYVQSHNPNEFGKTLGGMLPPRE